VPLGDIPHGENNFADPEIQELSTSFQPNAAVGASHYGSLTLQTGTRYFKRFVSELVIEETGDACLLLRCEAQF